MNWQKVIDFVKLIAPAIYSEIKSFFSTPLFFILLGCSFLYFAAKLMENTHPSFVFLLAILGISIVLYGTGTQGAGTAEPKDFPIKVAVAGGAGVLAAVFGYGILWQSDKIQKVFKTESEYGLIVLENKTNSLFDLTTLRITANSPDGRALHLLQKSNSIEILMPIASISNKANICITVASSDGKSMTGPNACPTLPWETITDRSRGDQITHVATGGLPIVSPTATRVDESNRVVEQFTFVGK